MLRHVNVIVIVILIVILSTKKAESQVAQSLPDCPNKCGNITIPYPFGIRKDCCLSEAYLVNCTTLRVMNTNFKLLNISLDDGLMHGLLPVAYQCYNSDGSVRRSQPIIRLSRFKISSTLNLLTTVGCGTKANLMDLDDKYEIACRSNTSCMSLANGSCSGQGCMQVPILFTPTEFRIQSQRVTRRVGNWSFNNCTYGFLVKIGEYTFQETDLDNMKNRFSPVALEWTVGNTSCEEAKKNKTSYLCTENSVCMDSHSVFNQIHGTYSCRCAKGYEGNPYLPDGCQDINECEGPQNECSHGCVNTIGSYTCPSEAAKSPGDSLYIGQYTLFFQMTLPSEGPH
ncbi:putative EGF-like calcium-binding domain-containing protein [Helianthus debilis subsp. tardiflorus]